MTTVSPDVTEPGFLADRRARASELVETLELPSFRGQPGWEFTSLKDLDLNAFPPAGAGDLALAKSVAPALEAPEGAVRLDQVDATFAPGPVLDSEGPLILPLSEAFASHAEVLEEHFGTIVSNDDPFVARNEAGWTGGAFVYVPRGVTVDAPIVVTAVHAAPGSAAHWRTLVVLEDGAEAEVWEQHLSADSEQTGLVTTVTELSVGQGASLRYIGAQDLASKTWVFGSQRAVVQRDGTLDWILLGYGSANG
ncbi:MAG: SufD family Fe-S cluster assembly protein, partial [Solirubrobacteraceae bacterium]|nr:SufD family Fe-S cluster assembly protein [Solirubrobacteraceae bacterium]